MPAVEGVLEPLDGAVAHDDHVEAHAALAQLAVPLQQQRGGRRDASLLGAADAGRRAAILVAGAGAHLGDHQQIPGAGHDVELTDATQEIARDDGESLRFEEGAGAVLGQ